MRRRRPRGVRRAWFVAVVSGGLRVRRRARRSLAAPGHLRSRQRVIAQAELERLLLGGVVAGERVRLGEPVLGVVECLDDRHGPGDVEHAPAAAGAAADDDAVLAASRAR